MWKFINWFMMCIMLIINPPCDECGYAGCEACDEETDNGN